MKPATSIQNPTSATSFPILKSAANVKNPNLDTSVQNSNSATSVQNLKSATWVQNIKSPTSVLIP